MMAEADFDTRPKTIVVARLHIELTPAEAVALKNLLNALPNPSVPLAEIKRAVNEAMAVIPQP